MDNRMTKKVMNNQPTAKMMATTLLLLFLILVVAGSTQKGSAQSNTGGAMSTDLSGQRVKMIFGQEEIFIRMHDNPTSRDFLKLLPLSLTLEDYHQIEKISYLSRKLTTQDAPGGSDPSVGDLTYYAPWGNLAIFYRDFGYVNSLIILGQIESGIEKLTKKRGDFDVRLELAE